MSQALQQGSAGWLFCSLWYHRDDGWLEGCIQPARWVRVPTCSLQPSSPRWQNFWCGLPDYSGGLDRSYKTLVTSPWLSQDITSLHSIGQARLLGGRLTYSRGGEKRPHLSVGGAARVAAIFNLPCCSSLGNSLRNDIAGLKSSVCSKCWYFWMSWHCTKDVSTLPLTLDFIRLFDRC